MMASGGGTEEYPHEIDEQLRSFDSSVTAVKSMLDTLVSMSRNELQQQLDPLDQAKLDLMSAYTLNSLFWVYLVTRGMNPREHSIKQELERIRTYMNRVKDIADKKKAARLDKGAASRFIRSAMFEPDNKGSRRKEDSTAQEPPPKRQKQRK